MPEINDIYTYIFSWRKVTENAVALHRQITGAGVPNVTLINCDENQRELGVTPVIQLDDSYYYGGQFAEAVRACPQDSILCCIVGDVSPDADWATIYKNAVAAFNRGDVGIYAPNVDYTWHMECGAAISDTLFRVPNTDCTCWFLSPATMSRIRDVDYRRFSNLGWGIDTLCIEETAHHGLLTVRDYSVLVRQPKGTAYNQQKARQQMMLLLRYYELNIKRAQRGT
jgi:hypothetical protein